MRKKVLFIVFVLFILFNFAFSYRMFLVKASSDLLVFLQDIFIIDDKDYSDYELIKDENVELKNEIEELKNTLDLNNTLVDKKIVNATIMSRNVTYFYDTFVVDKGSIASVEENMGALSNGYLVGLVTEVNFYSSKIKLLTDNKTKLSVKVNDSYGLLTGYSDSHYIVEYVSGEIKVGDMVMTSGLSDNIPSGIVIGEVEDIEKDNYALTNKLYVKPLTNLDNIRYVTLVGKK
ncbi:MAG: rod shape-determining protein MreC [Bacilli bacterium]|nr:rod shape-determining protein MreC [Bacilli bacterium]